MVSFTVTITNRLELGPVNHILPALVEHIRTRLTFINPKWEENEKHGFSNWSTSRELCFLGRFKS